MGKERKLSAQNTPLQPFKNKRELGKEILNYLKKIAMV